MSLIYLFHYFRRMCVFFPNFWRFTINITGNGVVYRTALPRSLRLLVHHMGHMGGILLARPCFIPWYQWSQWLQSHDLMKSSKITASSHPQKCPISEVPMAFPRLFHGHPKGHPKSPAVLRETGGGYEQHQFWHILCGPRAGDHGDLILTTMNSWISIINDMISI